MAQALRETTWSVSHRTFQYWSDVVAKLNLTYQVNLATGGIKCRREKVFASRLRKKATSHNLQNWPLCSVLPHGRFYSFTPPKIVL